MIADLASIAAALLLLTSHSTAVERGAEGDFD